MSKCPKSWQATIPDLDLISPNRLYRMHWSQRSRWKKSIEAHILAFGSGIVELEPKITLKITRFYGYRKRAFDKDNLYGACKPLIDALRDFAIIPDDTPKHIDLYVEQEKSPNKSTFVTIEAVECKG